MDIAVRAPQADGLAGGSAGHEGPVSPSHASARVRVVVIQVALQIHVAGVVAITPAAVVVEERAVDIDVIIAVDADVETAAALHVGADVVEPGVGAVVVEVGGVGAVELQVAQFKLDVRAGFEGHVSRAEDLGAGVGDQGHGAGLPVETAVHVESVGGGHDEIAAHINVAANVEVVGIDVQHSPGFHREGVAIGGGGADGGVAGGPVRDQNVAGGGGNGAAVPVGGDVPGCGDGSGPDVAREDRAGVGELVRGGYCEGVFTDRGGIHRGAEVSGGIGVTAGHELVVQGNAHIGVGDPNGDRNCGGGPDVDILGMRNAVAGGNLVMDVQRGIAHDVVDLPIVVLVPAAALLHRGIAHVNRLAEVCGPVVLGFAVGVEHGVVGAQFGGIVGMGRGLGCFIAHRPPVILTPVAAVAGPDVARGAPGGAADEGFPETDAVVELAGEAGVAHHHAVFVQVGHGGHVGGGEAGVSPASFPAVGGVVHEAPASVGVGDDGCVAGFRGGKEIGVRGHSIGGVEIVGGAVVHLAVALHWSVARVSPCDQNRFAQIAEVRHLGFLVDDRLGNHLLEFGGGGNRKAPVIQLRQIVRAVQPRVGEVRGMGAGAAGVGHYADRTGNVAHDQEVGGHGIPRRGVVPEVLEIGFDAGGAVGHGSAGAHGGNAGLDALLVFPVHERLDVAGVAGRTEDEHLHRGAHHPVAVVGAPVEEGGAVEFFKFEGGGFAQQLFRGGRVASAEIHADAGLMGDLQLAAHRIVARGLEVELIHPHAPHHPHFLQAEQRIVRERIPAVAGQVLLEGNLVRVLAFGQRGLGGGQRMFQARLRPAEHPFLAGYHLKAHTGAQGNGNQFAQDG